MDIINYFVGTPDSLLTTMAEFVMWMMFLVFVVGFPIYYFLERIGFIKIVMGPEGGMYRRSLKTYAKGIEIFAVLLAVIVFLYEFGYEKGRERATRNAQLLAQLADLSYDEDGKGEKLKVTGPAIRNIMEFLTREKVSMEGIFIPGRIDLANINLEYANLILAKLPDANLKYANLNNANIILAELPGANLEYANLNNANLEYANLNNANLILAELPGANLKGADLTNANLNGAFLGDANLEIAKLPEAKLLDADLVDANLTNANLNGAFLGGADLTNAKLDAAFIEGASLWGTIGLTQEMLDSARPSASPFSLPEELEWLFKQDENGEWKTRE